MDSRVAGIVGEHGQRRHHRQHGDIKLVPMLEAQLNDLSNLPRTSGGALDEQLLAKYNISVQPAGNGGYYLYAPLNLVEDKATGQKVAFGAQLLYQTAPVWQPQQVRLSWACTCSTSNTPTRTRMPQLQTRSPATSKPFCTLITTISISPA